MTDMAINISFAPFLAPASFCLFASYLCCFPAPRRCSLAAAINTVLAACCLTYRVATYFPAFLFTAFVWRRERKTNKTGRNGRGDSCFALTATYGMAAWLAASLLNASPCYQLYHHHLPDGTGCRRHNTHIVASSRTRLTLVQRQLCAPYCCNEHILLVCILHTLSSRTSFKSRAFAAGGRGAAGVILNALFFSLHGGQRHGMAAGVHAEEKLPRLGKEKKNGRQACGRFGRA